MNPTWSGAVVKAVVVASVLIVVQFWASVEIWQRQFEPLRTIFTNCGAEVAGKNMSAVEPVREALPVH